MYNPVTVMMTNLIDCNCGCGCDATSAIKGIVHDSDALHIPSHSKFCLFCLPSLCTLKPVFLCSPLNEKHSPTKTS